MSTNNISIKPNNHRVYPCPNSKKTELLNQLIEQNNSLDIVVVCAKDVELLKESIENKNIKVLEDKELVKQKDLTCEMIISYDMPIKSIVYMARISKATNSAVILLDASEQKSLYPIEQTLGRAIKQVILKGFEYEVIKPKEITSKKMSKEKIKEVAKKRYEEKTQDPKEKTSKPKRDYDDEAKKSYDKNGKKKERFDKTKTNKPQKVGRIIKINKA